MNQKAPPSRRMYKVTKILLLIVGGFISLLALFPFIEGAIGPGIVFLVLGGVFLLFSFALKLPAPPISIALLQEDAIKYIHTSKDSGEFAVVPTSMMLPAGEK